jgi:hypothetical protein
MNRRQIIALDADGVLLDYHASYRLAWQKAFGVLPTLNDPQAYWPWDRWSVQRLSLERRMIFDAAMDEEFWSTIPAVAGAQEACSKLVDAGYELVCVTALHPDFMFCRMENFRLHGFPIAQIFCCVKAGAENPKAPAIASLQPVAFVDDFAPYFRDIPPEVHAALVTRELNGSPNVGENLALAHSQHLDLAAFANWWLDRLNPGYSHVV